VVSLAVLMFGASESALVISALSTAALIEAQFFHALFAPLLV
jgi:hypothetical protein